MKRIGCNMNNKKIRAIDLSIFFEAKFKSGYFQFNIVVTTKQQINNELKFKNIVVINCITKYKN